MLELFISKSKVQKDRKIMRETDARMAKYSRRGLLFTFFVFLLALMVGEFYVRHLKLALILAVGLLLLTLIRAFLLFRFDSLYPRAPSRWRNIYFIASFAGAIWWSIILSTMTFTLGLNYEVPFMWFYTVIFFATITNVMAPYQRFMTLYLYIGIVPAAVAALLLGTVDGYLYGFTYIILLMLLRNQIRLVSTSYWDRLEANFLLKQRANSLEEENRDSLAAVKFNNTFLSNLSNDFRSSLNDIMGALSLLNNSTLTPKQKEWVGFAEKAGEKQLALVNNVQDFSLINSDSLSLDIAVFNLRRHLESILEDLTLEANRQGLELNYIFSQDLPLRVKGDAIRIGQIIINLVQIMINRSTGGELFFYAEQHVDETNKSILSFSIENIGGQLNLKESELVNNPYIQAQKNHPGIGLGLTISNGLCESMGGFIQYATKSEPNKFVFQLELEATGEYVKENLHLPSQRVLLFNMPSLVGQNIADTFEFWGLAPELVDKHDLLLERIDEALKTEHPISFVMIYADKDLSKTVASISAVLQGEAASKVLCVLGQFQEEDKVYRENKALFDSVECIHKPIIRHLLKEKVRHLVGETPVENDAVIPESKHILIVDDQRVDQQVVEAMVRKMGFKTASADSGEEALNKIDQMPYDLILLDCQMPGLSGYETAEKIRAIELETGKHVPIIAITSESRDGEQGVCLASGMDDYISKPARYNELQKRIYQWLNSSE